MPKQLYISLPFPPSVNQIWRTTKTGRMYLTETGKAYKNHVAKIVMERSAKNLFKKNDPLRVKIEVTMPDKRRRDIDNLNKLLLDSLEYAQVFVDDSQVKDLRIKQVGEPAKPGRLRVMINEIV